MRRAACVARAPPPPLPPLLTHLRGVGGLDDDAGGAAPPEGAAPPAAVPARSEGPHGHAARGGVVDGDVVGGGAAACEAAHLLDDVGEQRRGAGAHLALVLVDVFRRLGPGGLLVLAAERPREADDLLEAPEQQHVRRLHGVAALVGAQRIAVVDDAAPDGVGTGVVGSRLERADLAQGEVAGSAGGLVHRARVVGGRHAVPQRPRSCNLAPRCEDAPVPALAARRPGEPRRAAEQRPDERARDRVEHGHGRVLRKRRRRHWGGAARQLQLQHGREHARRRPEARPAACDVAPRVGVACGGLERVVVDRRGRRGPLRTPRGSGRAPPPHRRGREHSKRCARGSLGQRSPGTRDARSGHRDSGGHGDRRDAAVRRVREELDEQRAVARRGPGYKRLRVLARHEPHPLRRAVRTRDVRGDQLQARKDARLLPRPGAGAHELRPLRAPAPQVHARVQPRGRGVPGRGARRPRPQLLHAARDARRCPLAHVARRLTAT